VATMLGCRTADAQLLAYGVQRSGFQLIFRIADNSQAIAKVQRGVTAFSALLIHPASQAAFFRKGVSGWRLGGQPGDRVSARLYARARLRWDD